MEEDIYQKAKDDAFRLLSYRERSQYELASRLIKKGYSKNVADKVVNHLKTLGYIDDYRFCEKYVRHKIKNNPRGKMLLYYELRKKGLDEGTIRNVLEEMVPEETEINIGIKLATKWLHHNHNINKKLSKLKRYLNRKGFSLYIIHKIINQIENNNEKTY
ncbi:regulatory protein RecX [Halothermothrix orenii]|uniref:Regulatory protein RecX n=1 Tax=Halothermothrix orenii (strain H 168 / OCM 544 / DSM 9562) TaxID=373903 RepID=B8CXB9_HALOH|nr:regulatory protein RecX [Halothermothrix orenii]ACL69938.1 regulatory protein RecX [Halothermothrix orenii H 168]